MAYFICDESGNRIKAKDRDEDLLVTDNIGDIELKELSETDRSFLAVASTETPDRDGDIIRAKGWVLDNYLKAPTGLFCHDHRSLPIFRSLETTVKGTKLLIRPKFDDDDFSKEVFNKYRKKFLTSFSVGFIGLKWEELESDSYWGPREFKEQELLEVSAVPVPANPEALAQIKSMVKSDNTIYVPDWFAKTPKEDEKVDDSKDTLINTNIPFKSLPMDESETWNLEAELSEASVDDLKVMSAYYEQKKSNEKEGYFFVHHKADNYHVSLAGVKQSMESLLHLVLMDPDNIDDVKEIYEHLVGHYWQFGEDVPELKTYTEDELGVLFVKPDLESDDTQDDPNEGKLDKLISVVVGLTEAIKEGQSQNVTVHIDGKEIAEVLLDDPDGNQKDDIQSLLDALKGIGSKETETDLDLDLNEIKSVTSAAIDEAMKEFSGKLD